MKKLYCYNCGKEFDPNTDRFCTRCGVSFYEEKKIMDVPQQHRRIAGWVWPVLFIGIVAAVIGPFVFSWLVNDCGPIKVGKKINELEIYADHLTQMENASVNNKRPPAYILSQVDADIGILSANENGQCTRKASVAMNTALVTGSNYFGDLFTFEVPDREIINKPVYQVILIGREEYQTALREAYRELENLRSCQPFCGSPSIGGNSNTYP